MAKLRRGTVTATEIEYIKQNLGKKTPEELAVELNRPVKTVKNAIGKAKYEMQMEARDSYIFRLRASSFWAQTKKYLTQDEIEFFEQSWASYCDQLSTVDILPTDELTIKDLIMLDITCNRVLTVKMQIMKDLQRLRDMLMIEMQKKDRDDVLISTINDQISKLRNYEYKQDTYYKDIQAKKTQKLNVLKATRDQRLKNIEESKKNIWQLLKDLDTKEMRKQEGLINAKMKAAVTKLSSEWSQQHRFADGNYDQIYLTPETVNESHS